MITLHLARFCDSPMGVFGRLSMTSSPLDMFTVERPWINNTPGLSCIPAGRYEVVRERYHKGGYDALQVQSVAGRSEILFHVANTMDDVQGCIGVGSSLGFSKGKWAVLNSKNTFDKLMDSIDPLSNIEVRIVWQIPLAAAVDPTTRV